MLKRLWKVLEWILVLPCKSNPSPCIASSSVVHSWFSRCFVSKAMICEDIRCVWIMYCISKLYSYHQMIFDIFWFANVHCTCLRVIFHYDVQFAMQVARPCHFATFNLDQAAAQLRAQQNSVAVRHAWMEHTKTWELLHHLRTPGIHTIFGTVGDWLNWIELMVN